MMVKDFTEDALDHKKLENKKTRDTLDGDAKNIIRCNIVWFHKNPKRILICLFFSFGLDSTTIIILATDKNIEYGDLCTQNEIY